MPSTILQLPFTGGPVQKTAREYVNPQQNLLDVQNGIYTYDGAVDKRLGVAAVSTSVTPGSPPFTAPIKLLARGPELLATNGDSLFSYVPDNPPGIWSQRGYLPHCQATRASIAALPVTAVQSQIDEGNGYEAYVYRSKGAGVPGDVFFSLYSLTTRGPVLEGIQLTSNGLNYCPMVKIVGANCYIFWSDTTHVYGDVLNLSTLAFSGSSAIVSDASQNLGSATNFDVVATTAGLLLMYSQVTGSASQPRYLRIESLPALTITASAVLQSEVGTSNACFNVACKFDGTLGVAWFCWESQIVGTAGVLSTWAQGFTSAWVSLGAPFQFFLNGYTGNDTIAPIGVEPLAYGGTAATATAVFSGSPADSGDSIVTYNAAGTRYANAIAPLGHFASRPFRMTVAGQMRCYVLFLLSQAATSTVGAQVFSTYYVLDTQAQFLLGPGTNGLAIGPASATIAPRQSNAVTVAKMNVDGRAFAPVVGSNYVRIPVTTNASEELTNQVSTTAATMTVGVANLDFSWSTQAQYAEGNAELMCSGGMPGFYDGGAFGELGFPHWPICTVATTAASGGLTSALYGYAFCFAQADNQGLLHRSAFYTTSITPPNAANTVTVTVTNGLLYSWRSSGSTNDNTMQPVIEIYRTGANGTISYYVGSVPAFAGQTWVDAATDANIASNTLQYTTGGVLDSVNPPSAPSGIIRHVDRLWLIDDTQQNVWYTINFNSGDAPYFNETLTLSFTKETLTAQASMDDKWVGFSARSIWYVEGYGPNALGLGSDLTTAVQVPTDTGAADWRSVVTVPSVGVFFQSALNGLIYLLDRGLGVTCVGKVIQDWMGDVASGGVVTVLAAQQVPLTNTIRFVLSSGYVIFYDYVQPGPTGQPGRWSRSTYPSAPQCATVPQGQPWTIGGADGNVYQEKAPTSATKNYDTLTSGASQWVTTTITLADFKPGGGLQSAAQLDFVQCLARPLDPCDVMATLAYDYGSYQESRSFTWAQLSAGIQASPALAMWRVSPFGEYSQPMSVNLALSDAPPTGGGATTGAGMRWLGTAWSVSQIGAIYDKLSQVVRK